MWGLPTAMNLVPKVLHIPLLWPFQSVTTTIVLVIFVSLMATSATTTTATATTTTQHVNPQTTLGCHIRTYQFRVNKPSITKRSTGEVLTCSGLVTVDACWGRCGSSEVGTYQMPYRISNHRVCTYTSTVSRRVHLTECQGYPDPYIEVFDAEDCSCQYCNSDYTNCEKLTD